MNIITIESLEVEVKLPKSFGEPLLANDLPIPAGRYWECLLNGQEPNLPSIVRSGLIQRMEPTWCIVVIKGDPLPGDKVLGAWDECVIVGRKELMRPRPLLREANGHLIRFEGRVSDEELLRLFQVLENRELKPLAMVDSKMFAAKAEDASHYFDLIGAKKRLIDDVSTLVRAGVGCKRPGALSLDVTLEGTQFDKAMDGLVARLPVERPYITTLVQRQGDKLVWTKGMVTPPLVVNNKDTGVGFNANAQMKESMVAGPATMHIVSEFKPKMRARMDGQTVLWTLQDPEGFITQDRVPKRATELLSGYARRKAEAGIPVSLLMSDQSLGKHVDRFEVGAWSFPVTCDWSVPEGELCLTKTAWELLGCPPEHTWVVLHRHPARPDGSAAHYYKISEHNIDCVSDVGMIVLRPDDPAWKAAGGDFDGDIGNIWIPSTKTVLKPTLVSDLTYRKTGTTPMPRDLSGKPSLRGAILLANSGIGSMLGSITLNMRAVTEEGYLTDEWALKGTAAMQATIDCKKHPVDMKAAQSAINEIREYKDRVVPSYGAFSTYMNAVKRASGDGKVSAWKKLVLWAQGYIEQDDELVRISHSPINAAYAKRVLAWNAVYEEAGFLRGHRSDLTILKDIAKVDLLDNPNAPVEVALVKRISSDLRKLTRMIAEAGESAKEEWKLELREKSLQLRKAYYDGEVSASALIAYGPARTVAQMLTLADVERYRMSLKERVVVLKGVVAAGIYKPTELEPVHSDAQDWAFLVNGVDEVTVSATQETETGHTKALVTVVSRKPLEVEDLADEEEDPFM